jgi:hypothetical protein
MSFRMRVLTWQGTAIARDPTEEETDPEIAVGDGVDHQAEVVVPNRKDIPIVPIVSPAATAIVIRSAFLTVDLTVRLITEATVEPAVNQKRASNAYCVTDRTA